MLRGLKWIIASCTVVLMTVLTSAPGFAQKAGASLWQDDLAPIAADNYRLLRPRGFTVRGTIDVIIATWCIENKIALLHSDRDFEVFESELGLVCTK